MVKYPLTLKKQGWGGDFAISSGEAPQIKKNLSGNYYCAGESGASKDCVRNQFQRFDKSSGGYPKGRVNKYCQSTTILRRTTPIRTIRPQDHTSVRVTDTVTEVMSSGTLQVFM